MTIRPIPYPINLSGYGPPRTPGLHLSHILRAIAVRGHVFKPGPDLDEFIELIDPAQVGSTGALVRCILGYAIEDWYAANVLQHAIFHPGEYTLDGIIMTPDCIEEEPDCFTLHEIKGTFSSSARDFAERTHWLYQGACYLKVLSIHFGVPIADCRIVYHPCYIRGNYRGIDPEIRPQEVRLEQEEVDGVWNTVSRLRTLVDTRAA